MILSKNRIKNILKSKNKKQTKKKLKRKKKRREKKYNSFRKKKKNLRLQTIKNHNKKRIAKKKRKAYIHTGGSTTKLNIDTHIVSSFNYFSNLNKYIFSNPYQSQFVLRGGGVKTRSQTGAKAEGGNTPRDPPVETPPEDPETKAAEAAEAEGKEKTEEVNLVTKKGETKTEGEEADEGKTEKVNPETKEVNPETKEVNPETKEVNPETKEVNPETKEEKSEKKEDSSEVKEVGEPETKEDSNNSSNNTEITFSDNTKKYGKYFPIQFLFNPVDKLKVKILNDDDVGKTTETNKEEEQKTEDKKEIKSIQDQSKGDGLDFLDGPSTCSNKMVRFGNSYGLYYRSPGDCEDDKNVYGTIANIMGII